VRVKNCKHPRSSTGCINLAVSGDHYAGGGDAEHSTAVAMVETLRTEYGIFPTDYNYVLISEKRVMYQAMRICLRFFCSKYDEMDALCKNAIMLWTPCVHNSLISLGALTLTLKLLTLLRSLHFMLVSGTNQSEIPLCGRTTQVIWPIYACHCPSNF
jgi:hypothetical protein